MAEERAKRKLTAILSADVKGYSRLMGEDEISTVETLKRYREIISSLVQHYSGRVVDSPGDNILAEFSSVVDAVECAVKIQGDLQEKNASLPENRRMEFRIGVNLGDVIDDEGRIYGDGVNVAARVEGLAEGGGICISGTAFDQVKNKLNLGYEYLGEHSVKNIAEPVRVYKVLTEPEHAGKVLGEKALKPKQWRWAAVAIGIIIVAGALVVWNFYFRPPPIEPASLDKMAFPLPDKPSIAVLPFDNLSGDPKQAYLADGLTENIIGGLSKIPEMFVIARKSTFTYKDKPVKVQQVAEELGVRYVLEGSMQISDEQLRVTAQLIDALKGHHVWSEKYDRKMENFFSVQDDITLNIAVALQVQLTEGEQARVRHSTESLEAWALAVKAHGLFETYTRENIAKARELYKNAVELDPNYAYAWSYLGQTYWIDGVYHSGHYDRKKSFESAAEMAEKALSVDNNSSDAHALMSTISLSQKKYDEAEAFGKKTIDLDPNSSENHAIVAITMQNIGKFEEAIALLKQAMRLDPYYPTWYLGRLGMCYQMVGMYEESVEAYEETIKRFREREGKAPWDRVYIHLASTYSMMGRLEEARDLVSKSLEFNPKMSVSLWRKRLQFKDPKHTEHILDSLRKVGLPEHPSLPLPDKPSIAVLPFANMSGDPEQEYFSDGMTNAIIYRLYRLPSDILVIDRVSSFTYKGKSVKVQQVGRELGVRYVLEGSVEKSGDRIRITAQFIDATTGNHLWAERYDRKLKDVFAVQDEITRNVVTEMAVKLAFGEMARSMAHDTENFEAYDYYMQADKLFLHFEKESNTQARQLLIKAIELDPKFARPIAELGFTHLIDAMRGWVKNRRQSIKRAEELAKRAVTVDDGVYYGHMLLGTIYTVKQLWEQAIAAKERAVECEPNNSVAIAGLAETMMQVGRPEEGLALMKKAMRLSPYPPAYFYRLSARQLLHRAV